MWDEHGFKSLQWFYWISTELSVHVFMVYGQVLIYKVLTTAARSSYFLMEYPSCPSKCSMFLKSIWEPSRSLSVSLNWLLRTNAIPFSVPIISKVWNSNIVKCYLMTFTIAPRNYIDHLRRAVPKPSGVWKIGVAYLFFFVLFCLGWGQKVYGKKYQIGGNLITIYHRSWLEPCR